MGRPTWELADVVRGHEADLRATTRLSADQRRALRDVARCRTAAPGGHVEACGRCGHRRVAYNSCRNRHCPKCLAGQQAAWVSREAASLLPGEYHHLVFTLPAEVHPIGQLNPAAVSDALLTAAAEAVRVVAARPKHLGAQVGLVLVLHTWGQTLSYHPHVHGIATGGGLSCAPDGRVDADPRWVSCRPGFFLPVRVLSRVFRGAFLARMRAAFARGTRAGFADPPGFDRWCAGLGAKDWVVYAKPPFGGPAQVLKYLARSTHRVAIGNARLVDVSGGRVTFTDKDEADAGRSKEMTLDGAEFRRRWVRHVLPRGFVTIRHYGLLGNRDREAKLAVCRRRLFVGCPGWVVPVSAPEARPDPCPRCGAEGWAVEARFGPAGDGRAEVRVCLDSS